MAGNQSRTVELQIKLAGVQSLQELESVTGEINKELKQVSVNSKEFQKLSSMVQTANSKLKETGERLAGVTSTEKAEAVNKLGQGLVGAFQAGAGASLLFGEKTGEAMQKSIAKVASLFAITDGLKKLTEAFSAKNVAMLKATVKGWQESAVAVKLFGTATRTAIASTGIGLLVVAIGLVVANWDKVKKAMIGAFEWAKKFVPIFAAIGQVVDYLTEKVGNLTNLMAGLGAVITGIFQGDFNIAENFEKAVVAQDKLTKSTDAYNKTLTEGKDLLDKQLALMDAQGATELEKLDVQYKYTMGLVIQNKLIKERTPELDKQLKDGISDLAILTTKIQRTKQGAIDEKKVLQEKKRTQQEIDRDKAAAAREALVLQEADLLNSIEKLEIERKINAEIDKFNEALTKSNQLKDKFTKQEEHILDVLQGQLVLTDLDLKGIQAANDLLDKRINGDRKGNQLIEDRIENLIPSELRMTKQVYAEIIKYLAAYKDVLGFENDDFFKQTAKEKGDYYKQYLKYQIGINAEHEKENDYVKGLLQNAANELAIKSIISDLYKVSGEAQIKAANEINVANKELVKTNGEIIDSLKNQLDINNADIIAAQQNYKIAEDAAKVAEETAKDNDENYKNYNALLARQKLLQEELAKLENDKASLTNQLNTSTDEYNNKLDEVAKQERRILDIQFSIENAANQVKYAHFEILATLKEQIRAYAQLQLWITKYGQEIQAAQDLLNNSLALAADIAARRAEMAQRELDEYKAANDAKLASDIKLYEDGAAARKSINDELQELMHTAEGDRYDDLKAQQEKIAADEAAALAVKLAAEAEYNKQVALMQYEIDVAKWQAEKREKAGALISAAIQGALAVIEALPNIPLSIIVGASALAGIASIAAAPITPKPEVPKIEKGGMLQGASHSAGGIQIEAEGGEYIVNKRSTAQWLPLLEAINKPKFAEGGQVLTPNVVNNIPAMDYDRIGFVVAQALHASPIYTSWTEWKQVDSNARIIENRASIGR
jgi:hypothetical protein